MTGFASNLLKDRSVVVFGGTSGIGLSAAQQAKAAGARVIVVGFDPVGAERVAAENAFAGWRAADVTRPETITTALSDIPHVDHLVLLAGTFVAGKVLEADVGHLRRAFDERVWAAIHTLRALGDRLAADGSVTFISGVLADRPNAYGLPCSPPPPLRWRRWPEVWCWNWRRAASIPCLPAPPIRPCSRARSARDAMLTLRR
ncbi:SDR family oxidoreductase [Bradyrhizobium sp. CCBAU 21362]|uniref:SDR family oxidoreductase n=1 Tax=Bradyrhizobium sp. CCBAU 21362 TaxID=1325082 RepID=UPI002305EAFA|nr:SDR family oxidoreductase [Bradyrhizobium sp. CCBAU 21362]